MMNWRSPRRSATEMVATRICSWGCPIQVRIADIRPQDCPTRYDESHFLSSSGRALMEGDPCSSDQDRCLSDCAFVDAPLFN